MGPRILLLFAIIVLGTVTSQFAFADGGGPPACEGTPTDDWAEPEMSIMYDAGAGNTIDEICIKSGSNSFGSDNHSGVISVDGTYGDGNVANTCYTVSGLGTQTVTVTETGAAGCKSISHVDGVEQNGDMVGGHGGIPNKTALLVTGAQISASWMIPLLLSAVGIGIFVISYKKE